MKRLMQPHGDIQAKRFSTFQESDRIWGPWNYEEPVFPKQAFVKNKIKCDSVLYSCLSAQL